MHRLTVRAAASAGLAALLLISIAAAPPTVDGAFKSFWDARNPDAATKAAQAVAASGVAFDEALARLERGRDYAKQVKRGIVRLQRRSILGEFFYDPNVPDDYDPARKS